MAELKRNYIELVKEVKEGEIVTEKYFTPVFIPFGVIYEANDILEKATDVKSKEREILDLFAAFIAEKIYNKQFTPKELIDGLHAPDGIRTLQEQIRFVSEGYQSDETKKFMAKKR